MRSILACLILLLSCQPLAAEIQKVQVKWNPAFCTGGCVQLLARNFQNVTAIAQVNINGPGGQADLRWKPNFPFSYTPVNNAMQMVGVSWYEFRVKVRGILSFDRNFVYLTSLGDNTVFILLAPAQPQPGQFNVSYNIASLQLPPYLRAQLEQGARENRVAIVDGPLFQAERSPPLYLVIQQLNYVITEEEAQSQARPR